MKYGSIWNTSRSPTSHIVTRLGSFMMFSPVGRSTPLSGSHRARSRASRPRRIGPAGTPRTAGVASTPLARVPDHDAALGVAIAPVDLREHGGANHLAGFRAVLERDAPQHPMRIRRGIFEEGLLLSLARRMAMQEVT